MNVLPYISVIIPIYNVHLYLERALNNICNQTLSNIEILLIDDGSEDKSAQICAQFAKADSRIRFLSIPHRGVSAARNAGLDIATAEYIALKDSDVWPEVDMLEYLYMNALRYQADISTCEFIKEYADKPSTIRGSHKDYLVDWKTMIKEINYNGDFDAFLFNKIFRHSFLSQLRFPTGVSIGEDYDFIISVLLKHPVIFHGGACKYHYYQRSASISYTGFRTAAAASRNRKNYRKVYLIQTAYDSGLKESALAYFVLQEMAVIISMAKSDCYDKDIINGVKQEVRAHLLEYIKINRVPFYLKVCSILLSINERMLLLPYKVFFHRARSVSES